MTESRPLERARAVARREISALVEHSPSLRTLAAVDADHWLVSAELPYLTRPDARSEVVVETGFELGVHLPPRFPLEAPQVHFLARYPIFHPAICAGLPFVCVGAHAWSPDVGVAHFVALHVQAVVASIPLDTLDAFHGDPNCSDAAEHYRALQEAGELPIAQPLLRSTPASEARSVSRRRRAHRVSMNFKPADAMVKGRMGRRAIDMAEDRSEARCLLAVDTPECVDTREALAWLTGRLEAKTGVCLATGSGVGLAFPLDPGRGLDPAALEQIERRVRELELPVLALLRREIASAVADGLMNVTTG
jgi:ubiquitin-protein ligase